MDPRKDRQKEQLKAFGQHLRELRKAKGFNGTQFAAILDVDKQFLSRLELGQSDPRLTTLIRLAQALDVHVTEVLKGFDYPPAVD